MISQSLFLRLSSCRVEDQEWIERNIREFGSTLQPHVLVMNQVTKCGYYLDKQYRHIVGVEECKEPCDTRGCRISRGFKCGSVGKVSQHNTVWDTFWLY